MFSEQTEEQRVQHNQATARKRMMVRLDRHAETRGVYEEATEEEEEEASEEEEDVDSTNCFDPPSKIMFAATAARAFHRCSVDSNLLRAQYR